MIGLVSGLALAFIGAADVHHGCLGAQVKPPTPRFVAGMVMVMAMVRARVSKC